MREADISKIRRPPRVFSAKFRMLFQLALLPLPWKIRRPILERVFGWELHPTARLRSPVDCDMLIMGPNSWIGPLNVIRSIRHLELGRRAGIGRYNWIRVARPGYLESVERFPGYLIMGEEAHIISQHFVDVTGGFEIDRLAGLGGGGSRVVGHAPDMAALGQAGKFNHLAERSMLASAVMMQPGTQLAPGVMVSMGSVIRGHLDQENAIYAGNPAKPVKVVDNAFVNRTTNDWDF